MKNYSKKQVLWALAGLVVAVFFWAANAVVAKGVVSTIPPLTLAFYRWITAIIIFFPFAWPKLKQERQVIRKNIGPLMVLALPSVGLFNTLLYLGARYTSAINMGIMVSSMPAVTLGLAWIMTRKRPALGQTLGIILSMAGVAAIIGKGSIQTFLHMNINPGDIIVFGGVLSWAYYTIMLKKKQVPVSGGTLFFMTMILGIVPIFPFYLWEFCAMGGISVNLHALLVFVFLAVCPSMLAYMLWNYGVKVMGPSTASVFIYLLPVFAAIIAHIVLGERLSLYHITGGCLIFLGLLLSSYLRPAAEAEFG